MKTWPDKNDSIIDRYLSQLRLRNPTTPIYYRQALRSFRELVSRRQCSPARISRDDLEVWLRERAVHWPESMVLHRARVVNRFLDFLVQEELIASNPVTDLRAAYCVRSSHAILRALLAPDPDQALEALRQYPPFGSVLGGVMQDHIALMHSRGFRYETQARYFLRFDRFLQSHPELSDAPLPVMLQHWSAARSTPNHRAECEKLARALTKALRHVDPAIKPRRPDPRPAQQVARQWRRPYIYSPEEIRSLLDIASTYPSPRAPLRPISLYTMLVLAYCAGLRVGEIARLNLGDVDLESGTISIRETSSSNPESCRCPAAHCRRCVSISKQGVTRKRRKTPIPACSGTTRGMIVTPLTPYPVRLLTFCGAPESNRRKARSVLAFTTYGIRSS